MKTTCRGVAAWISGTFLAVLIAGCSATQQEPAATAEPGPATPAAPPPSSLPDGIPDPNGRSSRYTDLKDCRITTDKPEEAGYRVSECDGPAPGYGVRLVESDGRHNLFVRVPGGEFASLRLSGVSRGAFNGIAGPLEWRGPGEGDAFAPDTLVFRHEIAEDMQQPSRDTSYLIAVALGAQSPCIADVIAPGPDQSAKARAVADSAPACRRD